MMKTKIKRALALITLVGVLGITSNVGAVQIGTGSVVGTGAYDSSINWDGTFTAWSASGSVSNILVKAKVDATLNMSISTGTIDLGTLLASITSTGGLDLEIGTNAKSGVSITARSGSGGLTNTSSGAIQINDLTADGLAESYTFVSTPNGTDDSSNGAFSASGLSSTEVNDNSTEHTVYTTNKPEATNLVDDVAFEVGATIGEETPAGDYEDRITFTVTGNF